MTGHTDTRDRASALAAFRGSSERVPPLSAEQQSAAASLIREEVARFEGMRSRGIEPSSREVDALERTVEQLCSSCWRLAWLIVREQAESRYGRDKAREHLPDLMSEANLALVRAAYTFDPSMTPKFATYAARLVRDHVRAVLSKEGYIRLAPSWGRVKRIAATRIPELTFALGRAPTTKEIQADLLERCLEWAYARLSPEEAALSSSERRKAAMAKLRKQGMLGAIRDIEEVLVASQSILSLEQPISEDGGFSLGHSVSAEDGEEGYRAVEMSGLADALREALSSLSERERSIVLLRYGFDGSEGWTYGRIAEQFGVSSERIRQIEKSALERISISSDGSLRAFLD